MTSVRWISTLHSVLVFLDVHGTEEPLLIISLESYEQEALDSFLILKKIFRHTKETFVTLTCVVAGTYTDSKHCSFLPILLPFLTLVIQLTSLSRTMLLKLTVSRVTTQPCV